MPFNCTVDAGKNQCSKRNLGSRWWWRSSKRASSFLPLKAGIFLVLRYGRAVAALHVRVGWLPRSVRGKKPGSPRRWNNFFLLFVCRTPFLQKWVCRGSFVPAPDYLGALCRFYCIENPLRYGKEVLNFELAHFFLGFLTCGWDVCNERSIIKNHLVEVNYLNRLSFRIYPWWLTEGIAELLADGEHQLLPAEVFCSWCCTGVWSQLRSEAVALHGGSDALSGASWDLAGPVLSED